MVDQASTGDFTQWIIAAGMSIGAGIAGVIIRGAWKPSLQTTTREFTMTGQAQITDMGPIRDLVKQAEIYGPRIDKAIASFEAMGLQQARTAENIDQLVVIVRDYIEEQKSARENDDAYQRGRDDAIRTTRPPRPRARRKTTTT